MSIEDIGAKVWFRPEVRGLENVPAGGGVVLVATRSGGRRNIEAEVLHLALRERADAARDLIVANSPEVVAAGLDQGAAVLVQPVDPAEAHRASWEAPRVDGDAAAALLAPAVARGAAVIPVALSGGQDTALFLGAGDRLTHRLGLDRVLHLERLPLSLSIPWGFGLGATVPNVPLPVRISAQVLAPLAIADRLGDDPDPGDVARWAAAAVESASEALLDARRAALPLAGALTRTTRVLVDSGLVGVVRPDALARAGVAVAGDGVGLAAGYRIAAARFPDAPAVIDDDGVTSFAELTDRIGALAAALHRRGVDGEHRVGVLARNSRAFLEATAAASRLGADVVLLNTSFAGPQLADVLARERVGTLIADPASNAAWRDARGRARAGGDRTGRGNRRRADARRADRGRPGELRTRPAPHRRPVRAAHVGYHGPSQGRRRVPRRSASTRWWRCSSASHCASVT